MSYTIYRNDVMPFGKYKSQNLTLEQVLAKDPGYLMWLRDQKLKDTGRTDAVAIYESSVHEILDECIGKNGYRKFSKIGLTEGEKMIATAKLAVKTAGTTPAFSVSRETVTSDLPSGASVKPVEDYTNWGEF